MASAGCTPAVLRTTLGCSGLALVGRGNAAPPGTVLSDAATGRHKANARAAGLRRRRRWRWHGAGLCAALVAGGRPWRGRPSTCRRASASGAAEEARAPDPGRAALMAEFLDRPGKKVFSRASSCGNGHIVVTQHAASEQSWPGQDPCMGPWTMEWRQLRFLEDEFCSVLRGCDQSVAKVAVLPHVRVPVVRADVLALGYTKTCVAVALGAAQACGAALCEEGRPLRALVVGLGAGSMPLWLTDRFPWLRCDVAEADPAVIAAATEALGFPAGAVSAAGSPAEAAQDALRGDGGRLRAYVCRGEDFACALAERAPEGFGYDLVIVDAFDWRGRVPEPITRRGGPFLEGIKRLLRPRAGIALNLNIDVGGSGSSGTPREVARMATAFHGAASDGHVFSVRVLPSEGANLIIGFTTAPAECREGEDLAAALKRSCAEIGMAVSPSFDIVSRLGIAFEAGMPAGGSSNRAACVGGLQPEWTC
mmetsp:Transcript_20779/g.65576  ORF Transcript_20779/g.65576 Transcript_20779/m.65576 type:complete len:479 (-) Transcript_20779:22-1458(-)